MRAVEAQIASATARIRELAERLGMDSTNSVARGRGINVQIPALVHIYLMRSQAAGPLLLFLRLLIDLQVEGDAGNDLHGLAVHVCW